MIRNAVRTQRPVARYKWLQKIRAGVNYCARYDPDVSTAMIPKLFNLGMAWGCLRCGGLLRWVRTEEISRQQANALVTLRLSTTALPEQVSLCRVSSSLCWEGADHRND